MLQGDSGFKEKEASKRSEWARRAFREAGLDCGDGGANQSKLERLERWSPHLQGDEYRTAVREIVAALRQRDVAMARRWTLRWGVKILQRRFSAGVVSDKNYFVSVAVISFTGAILSQTAVHALGVFGVWIMATNVLILMNLARAMKEAFG